MASSPSFVSIPRTSAAFINTGMTTSAQTLWKAGNSGSKIVGVYVTSYDTVAANLVISVGNNTSGNLVGLGCVSVPAMAGSNNSIPILSVFTSSQSPSLPVDNDGQTYLFLFGNLSYSDTLMVNLQQTTSAGKNLYFLAVGGDF